MKAVFLDRDGVINQSVVRDGLPYPPHSVAEFQILEDVPEACRLLKQHGFLLVVATNQPDVGRGTLLQEEVEKMHAVMCKALPIDSVEVAFDSGYTPSDCRKPAPGMLLRAAQELGISLPDSYMVGDRWRDVDCGHAAGCCTLFIDNGYAEDLRQKPDYWARNLLEAARIIVEIEKSRTGT